MMISRFFIKLWAWQYCCKGATSIEYALIAGGVSLAIVGSVFLFGDDLQSYFETMGTAMDNHVADIATRVAPGPR